MVADAVAPTPEQLAAGLTSNEAARRLRADGPNELPAARQRPVLFRFAAELVHFFALMLWVAALLAWVAGLVSLAVAIAAVVVLNAVFSFVQERRADRAADRLRVLLPSEVHVRRDGVPVAVDASEVVGGDVVLLETVGVGQSEVEVAGTADTTVVLVAPGMGDGIQAAKAGLLEVGDVFVVNKADLPGSAEVVRDLRQMLELGPTRDWEAPIVTTVASVGEGVDDVAEAIRAHRSHLEATGSIHEVRRRRAALMIKRARLSALAARMDSDGIDADLIDRVTTRDVDPWSAADM